MRFGPPIPLLSCLLLTGAGPSGGGQSLQAPTDFNSGETPGPTDVSVNFSWSPPTSGPAPSAYRFVFNSDITGSLELLVTDTVASIGGVPFNIYWTAYVWSRLGEQESENAAFTYGTTSSGSYP